MKMFKSAAVFLGVYAFILLGNGLFYLLWSQDVSELPRLMTRIIGVGIIAYGLWTSTKWGWWAGLLFSGIFAVLGLVALFSLATTGLLYTRPYPLIDLIAMGMSSLALLGTFVCLLTPTARAKKSGSAGGL